MTVNPGICARLNALAEEWFECCGDIHEPLIEAASVIADLLLNLKHAVEIIEQNVHVDALGINWDGNDEAPGGTRSWYVRDEYLHYMRVAIAKAENAK